MSAPPPGTIYFKVDSKQRLRKYYWVSGSRTPRLKNEGFSIYMDIVGRFERAFLPSELSITEHGAWEKELLRKEWALAQTERTCAGNPKLLKVRRKYLNDIISLCQVNVDLATIV